MHAICETHAFQRAAKLAGMAEDEIAELTDYLARNPFAGDEIEGTGGYRKVRVAGKGKGKSGGYRTITFFSGADLPVFLITVFAKGDKATLTKGEKNQLKDLAKVLVAEYRKKVVKVRAGA